MDNVRCYHAVTSRVKLVYANSKNGLDGLGLAGGWLHGIAALAPRIVTAFERPDPSDSQLMKL
jgi:hypothetical protein